MTGTGPPAISEGGGIERDGQQGVMPADHQISTREQRRVLGIFDQWDDPASVRFRRE